MGSDRALARISHLHPAGAQPVWTKFLTVAADGTLARHTAVTLLEIALGLLIGLTVALVSGYILGKNESVERILSPYIVASQSVPIVAIAPLLIIWFGSGLTSKVLVVALITFFPTLVSTIVGIRSVDADLRDLMRSLRASRWQMFRLLELPSALPVIFGGLKLSVILAVVGAVVGEFVGADVGLGLPDQPRSRRAGHSAHVRCRLHADRHRTDALYLRIHDRTLQPALAALNLAQLEPHTRPEPSHAKHETPETHARHASRSPPARAAGAILSRLHRAVPAPSAAIPQPPSSKSARLALPDSGLVPITLGVGFVPNVQFAPFYVGIEKGFFRDAGLDVDLEYGFENDYLKLVGTDDAQFMIGSGDQVVLGRAQGLPVRYVMKWYTKFPVVIMARQDAGITTPADLAGKTIGIPGPFGASYVAFRGILEAAGLDERDVSMESIGFTQAAALADGAVDAAVDYAVNGPVVLAAEGIATDQIVLDDYLRIPANGLVTNEETIRRAAGPGASDGRGHRALHRVHAGESG